MEITIIQGADVFYTIFNAVALFVGHQTWQSVMVISETIGLFALGIAYVKHHDLKTIGMWFLSFLVINAILLTPTQKVIIRDISQHNNIRQVDNVPLGVAVPIYLVTSVGNSIARTYDTLLSQPEDLQYSNTGLLFGSRLIEHSFDVVPPTPELAQNISNFVKFCIVERNMISHEFDFAELRTSDNLISFFSKGKAGDDMKYYDRRRNTSGFLDCKTAGEYIKNDIAQANSDAKGTLYKFAQKLGLDGMIDRLAGTTAIARLNSQLPNVQRYYAMTSKSAADILTQNMLVNQFKKAVNSYPVNLDASSALINQTAEQSLTKMKLSHMSSYQVSGRLIPALHSVLLALMIGLFPIMVLALFVRELAWNVVKNYLSVLFSLMMWPLMFAIFNSIMNALQYQTLNGQSFTISNADNLKENATTMAGVAMWLTASIPFLSFRLVTSLGQNLASAGSYLGNAMSSATTADASQVAAGNYNWGNMQTHNINGNKVDMNHLTKMGQSTIQNSDGVLTTKYENDRMTTDTTQARSQLSLGLNFGSLLSSSYSQSASAEQRKSEEATRGAREALTQATNTARTFQHTRGNQHYGGDDHSHTKGNGGATAYGEGGNVTHSKGSGDKHNSDNSHSKSSVGNVNISGELFGKVGTPFGGIVGSEVGVRGQLGKGHQWSNGENDSVNRSRFTDNLINLVNNYSKNQNFDEFSKGVDSLKYGSLTTDESRVLNAVTSSVNQAHELYKQASESNSKAFALSQAAQYVQQNSVQVNENMETEFEHYLRTSGKYSQDEVTAMLSPVMSSDMRALRDQEVNQFIESRKEQLLSYFESNKGQVQNTYGKMSIDNYGVSQSAGAGVGLSSAEQNAVAGNAYSSAQPVGDYQGRVDSANSSLETGFKAQEALYNAQEKIAKTQTAHTKEAIILDEKKVKGEPLKKLSKEDLVNQMNAIR